MEIVVYFDFLCPFAYAASLWLDEVRRQYQGNLNICWRFFSLEQVNSHEGAHWKLWEQPLASRSRSLLAFRVAAAARQVGGALYDRVRHEIFQARHARHERINDPISMARILDRAGLGSYDLLDRAADPSTAALLRDDHTEAVERYSVFGTPTLVVDGRHAAYLKMSPAPPAEEALKVFYEVIAIVAGRPNIYEIKRPSPT